MKTILDTITAHKQKEVAQKKTQFPLKVLEASGFFERDCHSLTEILKTGEKSGIITEFKRKSPSKGMINAVAAVEKVVSDYTTYGASGLSVLTDTRFFGGSNTDLKTARMQSHLPILRKDFVVDDYQIIESKALGADLILLIAECLSAKTIKQFTTLAKSLGLEVLLEMHSAQEMHKIGPENTLIGINNRDLKTFKVDIKRAIAMADKLPEDSIKIAESGIHDPEVVTYMEQAGFDGFLMGERFMKTSNPGKTFQKFNQAVDTLSHKQIN